jgi:hypothetical protein
MNVTGDIAESSSTHVVVVVVVVDGVEWELHIEEEKRLRGGRPTGM